MSLEFHVTTGNLFGTTLLIYCPAIALVLCHYRYFISYYYIVLLSAYCLSVMSLLAIRLTLLYCFTVTISLASHVPTGSLFDTTLLFCCPDIALVSYHCWQFIWHCYFDLLYRYRLHAMSIMAIRLTLLYCLLFRYCLHVMSLPTIRLTLFYCFKGDRGYPGESGRPGQRGAPGERGPQGPSGESGPPVS